MNVPAIRRELEGLLEMGTPKCPADGRPCFSDGISVAVVRVGLRACDELDEANHVARNAPRGFPLEGRELAAVARLSVIEDILREAGVEVVND